MAYQGSTFAETGTGTRFQSAVTVTDAHLTLAAGMFGDFNPLHVDEQFAAASRYGGRILHGPFTSALISAPVGMYFAGTAIGYLEHSCRFLAPVRPGDTLTTRWVVVERLDKPRHDGGILVLHASCRNQDGAEVATAVGKILVSNHRPAAS